VYFTNRRVDSNRNQSGPGEARPQSVPSCKSVGHLPSHSARMGAGVSSASRPCQDDAPANSGRRLGGQHSAAGLFGISDRCLAANSSSAPTKRSETPQRTREAQTQGEGRPAQMQAPAPGQGRLTTQAELCEDAYQRTARQLREFRMALAAMRTRTVCQPRRRRVSQEILDAREAACESVARKNRVFAAFLAAGRPLTAEETEAAANPKPQAAAPKTQAQPLPPSNCRNALRAPDFNEEAALEYEAYLDEIAEARARQLDDEADQYARSYIGAGYTEYLMAIEG
jgi:hypothetical protein